MKLGIMCFLALLATVGLMYVIIVIGGDDDD